MSESTETQQSTLVDKHETWTNAGPLLTHLFDNQLESLRERSAATISEPAALGLWGFATGTWMMATLVGGYVPQSYAVSLAPTAVYFGGIAQFIAGLYAYRRADVMGATVFTCFGAFNTALGVMYLLRAAGAVTVNTGYHEELGFLLESFAFIALALAAASWKHNVVLLLVLSALAIGYCLGGVGQFLMHQAAAGANAGAGGLGPVSAAGGALLFASSLCAYYLGLALLVNSTWNMPILPILGRP